MCEEAAGQRSGVERGCSLTAHGLWDVRAWESEPCASVCFSLTLWAPEWHRADPTLVAQLCQGSACSSEQRKALTATLPSCPHQPHRCFFSVFIYIPPTSTISWCWTQSTQREGNGIPFHYSCQGKFHGQRILECYNSIGLQRVGHD